MYDGLGIMACLVKEAIVVFKKTWGWLLPKRVWIICNFVTMNLSPTPQKLSMMDLISEFSEIKGITFSVLKNKILKIHNFLGLNNVCFKKQWTGKHSLKKMKIKWYSISTYRKSVKSVTNFYSRFANYIFLQFVMPVVYS